MVKLPRRLEVAGASWPAAAAQRCLSCGARPKRACRLTGNWSSTRWTGCTRTGAKALGLTPLSSRSGPLQDVLASNVHTPNPTHPHTRLHSIRSGGKAPRVCRPGLLVLCARVAYPRGAACPLCRATNSYLSCYAPPPAVTRDPSIAQETRGALNRPCIDVYSASGFQEQRIPVRQILLFLAYCASAPLLFWCPHSTLE